MSNKITVYCSYHQDDRPVVDALKEHLKTIRLEQELHFIDYTSLDPDSIITENTREQIESADLILLFCSTAYYNREETIREQEYALRSPRAPLIIPLTARSTPEYPGLEAYEVLPDNNIPLLNEGKVNDLLCSVVTRRIIRRLSAFLEHGGSHLKPVFEALPWSDAKDRILSHLDKNDLGASLALLNALVKDPDYDKIIFEAREEYERLHRKSALENLGFQGFWQELKSLRSDIEQLVYRLDTVQLYPEWEQSILTDCLVISAIAKKESKITGLSMLADQIGIPTTRLGDNAQPLTVAQQQEYKRLFILAQDALAIGEYTKASALAEEIRAEINPESAQLYELLFLSHTLKEGADQVVRDFLRSYPRNFETLLRYAERFQEFQTAGKCKSDTGHYNSYQVATSLQSAIKRAYSAFPNDYILDTGLNATRHPESRDSILACLNMSNRLYRFMFPATGFFETAFNEFSGGGKYQWADEIEVVEGRFRVFNKKEFDVLSELNNLLQILNEPANQIEDNPVERDLKLQKRNFDQKEVLRGNLLIHLKRKRTALLKDIETEKRFFREFIDERDSLARFVYACILGYLALDKGSGEKSQFLELALDEVLMKPEIPWFTLDDEGELIPHPDCERINFDVKTLTGAIINHYAGEQSEQQILKLIRERTYEQYILETREFYDEFKEGLSYTDFRRLSDGEARKRMVSCLRKWTAIFRADKEKGATFLHQVIRELTGQGEFLWMLFDPDNLVSHPDSLALGFDAVALYKNLQQHPLPWEATKLEEIIVEQQFSRHILPSYNAIPKGAETERQKLIFLIRQSLRAYKTVDDEKYLDWVYRELTEEVKFRWLEIDADGLWNPTPETPSYFDPVILLYELARLHPRNYEMYETRRRIAENRFREAEARYRGEISEFRHENKEPERKIAIELFRDLKGIFRFFPDLKYIELPLRELNGRGRILWQSKLFGIFLIPDNHHENLLVNFDYKSERAEFMAFEEKQAKMMAEMLEELQG